MLGIIMCPPPLCAQTPTSRSKIAAPVSSKESAELRDRARAAIKEGNLEVVGQLIEQTRNVVIPTERTAWWLIESEWLFNKKQFARSALVAMQIVILHPKSEQAGPALFWAGRCYEELGRPTKAIELYQECTSLKSLPGDVRAAATRRLSELKKKAP